MHQDVNGRIESVTAPRCRNGGALLSAFVGGICTRICAAMIAELSEVMRKAILRKDEIDGIAPVTALR